MFSLFTLLLIILFCLPNMTVAQEITTTITHTQGAGDLGTSIGQAGNVHNITGGARQGNSLFHSFSQFNVGSGDIANFQNSVVNGAFPRTDNILSRVTGGEPSMISGTLRTTDFGNANLFLMNPQGVVFGPTASLDIGAVTQGARGSGSFIATTADYLRMGDGPSAQNFYTDVSQESILTSASVSAFGFLPSNPGGAITVQGSQLSIASGQSISLVGKDVTIQAGIVTDGTTVTTQRSLLSAPNGQINLASTASPGEFILPNMTRDSFAAFGSIHLAAGSKIDVSEAGAVSIRDGQFVLSVDNAVLATTEDVTLPNTITLSQESSITTGNSGTNPGTDIELIAGTVKMNGGSTIETRTRGVSNAGNIFINVSDSLFLEGVSNSNTPTRILSITEGTGSTGSIVISGNNATVELDNQALIETNTFGQGAAGDISLDVRQVTIAGGAGIQTSGNALNSSGNIRINATESISLDGQFNFSTRSRILNQNGDVGGTGGISIDTGNLILTNTGRIFSDTFFSPTPSESPKVSIHADDSVTLSEASEIRVINFASDVGGLELSAKTVSLDNLSAISTFTFGEGRGGNLSVIADDLNLAGGSQIISSSLQGIGSAGDISINVSDKVRLTGSAVNESGQNMSSGVFTSTTGDFDDPIFTGDAGRIDISANRVEVLDGARIDTSSNFFALGNGGEISITALSVLTSGGTISTSTEYAGNAGSIGIKTDNLTVNHGGQLTSSSKMRLPLFEGDEVLPPTGNAGTVSIQGLASSAQSVLIDGPGSGIFTNTQGAGAGGNILIETSQSTTLTNGAAISASSTGTIDDAGDAGMVTIHAGNTFFMQDSSVTTQATKSGGGQIEINASDLFQLVNSRVSSSVLDGTGGGGDINIDPNLVVLQNSSQILAQAIQGTGGNITITTPLFLSDQSSLVSASSQFGLNGTVTIQSPTSNLSGSLGPLTSKPSQAQSLLTQRCAALANGQASSFVVAGREQLPADPGGWLTSQLAFAGLDADPYKDGTVADSTSNFVPRTSGLLANGRVSLRRLTPTRFLMANFADSEATGCHS
jgi:filamentous hemagglutinin family protein